MSSSLKGFSLLELSIVLVIIGLLAGGVMVGQDLVAQAELRSIMSDMNRIGTAVNTFKNKYQAIPGDMINATSYWGTASGGCPDGARSGTQTCNGNGNNWLGWNEISTTTPEWWSAWTHLSNAGLVEGSFTGMSGIPTNDDAEVGENVPESKRNGVGYQLKSDSIAAHTTYWSGYYPLYLQVGTEIGGDVRAPGFTPQEAESFDLKIDDGRPGTGIVRAPRTGVIGCASSTSNKFQAAYEVADSGIFCSIMYSLTGDPG